MSVPVFRLGLRFGKVDMPPAAYVDRTARSTGKLVEMVLVKVRAETNLMHMVTVSHRNGFAAHRGKAVVVRIAAGFRNLRASDHLVHMPLFALTACVAARLTAASAVYKKIHDAKTLLY